MERNDTAEKSCSYKLWCLCYLIQFEPYQGKGMTDNSLGFSWMNCGLHLLSKLPALETHCCILVTSFYTSFNLLDTLSELGIGATLQIKANRIGICPITVLRRSN